MKEEYLKFCEDYNLNPNLAISLGLYYTYKDLNKNENKENEKEKVKSYDKIYNKLS